VEAICFFFWLALRYSWVIGLTGAFVFLPLVPVLAGLRVYEQGDMTHDRYLYLPSVGLCLLFGLLVNRVENSGSSPAKGAVNATAVILLGLCGYLTIAQQKFYANDEVLYKRAIEVGPNNTLAMDFLGNTYLQEAKPDLAMAQYREAYRLAPEDSHTKFALARGLFKTQDYREAEVLFDELVRDKTQPFARMPAVLLTDATIKAKLGQTGQAEGMLRMLEEQDPRYPGLHRTLGTLYQTTGDAVRAQAEYAKEFSVSGDREAGRKAVELMKALRPVR
jgi:Tfp pilus assembly protein PilF